MTLQNKKVLLGISGGIAAYKCVELTRRLKDRGVDVRIVMTEAAKAFVTPLTFQAVSGHSVSEGLLDPQAEAAMGHIELAKWADVILLPQATADLVARMAAGLGNDLLSTLVLASPAPVIVAPVMNQQMYTHPATQRNLNTLEGLGYSVWQPASGEQACGDIGPGRMIDPLNQVARLAEFFTPQEQPLAGKRLTLTAGPTREAMDPVRYISNHSSGKMGFALAEAAAAAGAEVTLIAGPVNLPTPEKINRINVSSARDMHLAAMQSAKNSDIFIACAAVADYRPAHEADQKIKKKSGEDEMVIRLIKNPDIVADVAALSANERPFTVGFAAETQDVEHYARGKLERKGLDMICANDVAIPGLGFNSDQNALQLIWKDGQQSLGQASKIELAHQVIQHIAKHLN